MCPVEIDLRRLWLTGPFTVLASIAAVLVVRIVAVSILEPSEFAPLGWEPLIVFTAVLVTAAVLVFAVVARLATTPVRTYRRIAFVVLVLSLVPDFLLPGSGTPGATWPAVSALMVMHVAAWWVTVQMLTRLTGRVLSQHAADQSAGAARR